MMSYVGGHVGVPGVMRRVAVALLLLLWGGAAWGATYYVDAATGNDSDSGLTEALAFATPRGCVLTMNGGDTCLIKNGTYIRNGSGYTPGFNFCERAISGASGAYTIIKNFPGHAPKFCSLAGCANGPTSGPTIGIGTSVGCGYFRFEGLEVDGSFWISGDAGAPVHHVTVTGGNFYGGNDCDGNYGPVRLEDANNVQFDHNWVHGLTKDGCNQDLIGTFNGVTMFCVGDSILEYNTFESETADDFQRVLFQKDSSIRNVTRYNHFKGSDVGELFLNNQNNCGQANANEVYGNVFGGLVRGAISSQNDNIHHNTMLAGFTLDSNAADAPFTGTDFRDNLVQIGSVNNALTTNHWSQAGTFNFNYNLYDPDASYISDRFGPTTTTHAAIGTWRTALQAVGCTNCEANSTEANITFEAGADTSYHVVVGSPAKTASSTGGEVGAYGVTSCVGSACGTPAEPACTGAIYCADFEAYDYFTNNYGLCFNKPTNVGCDGCNFGCRQPVIVPCAGEGQGGSTCAARIDTPANEPDNGFSYFSFAEQPGKTYMRFYLKLSPNWTWSPIENKFIYFNIAGDDQWRANLAHNPYSVDCDGTGTAFLEGGPDCVNPGGFLGGALGINVSYPGASAKHNYFQNIGAPVVMQPGSWTCLEWAVTPNSVAQGGQPAHQSNGRIEMWIDGVKKLDHQNINVRGTSATGIRRGLISTYWNVEGGGTAHPPLSTYYDDIVVGNAQIGCGALACGDGLDNDLDGKTDYHVTPGVGDSACLSAAGTTESVCGDNYKDAGEDCDGTAMGTGTCITEGFEGQVAPGLTCAVGCTYDTVNCRDDCEPIPNVNWVATANSEQAAVGGCTPAYPASAAINGDSNSATFWHTQYVNASCVQAGPSVPHQLQIDLGAETDGFCGFDYRQRHDGVGVNGNFREWEIYTCAQGADCSNDLNWTIRANGEWDPEPGDVTRNVTFPPVNDVRQVRLKGISTIQGTPPIGGGVRGSADAFVPRKRNVTTPTPCAVRSVSSVLTAASPFAIHLQESCGADIAGTIQLGDNAVYASATKVTQPKGSWVNGKVQGTIDLGAFACTTPLWLFVTPAGGGTPSAGFPVTACTAKGQTGTPRVIVGG